MPRYIGNQQVIARYIGNTLIMDGGGSGDPPVANNDTAPTVLTGSGATDIDVLANDDLKGLPVTVFTVQMDLSGPGSTGASAVKSPAGNFVRFTPGTGVGTWSVSYTVHTSGGSDTAVVTGEVTTAALNDYIDRMAATSPQVWLKLNETAGATAAANAGSLGTARNGTYQNTGGIRYRLGTLIQSPNTGGRSIALSGATSNTPHITVPSFITSETFTIDLAVQVDLYKPKHVLVTTGQGAGGGGGTPINGQFSLEIQNDVTLGMRVRSWTVVGGVADEIVTDYGELPVGTGCKITFIQRSGAGGGRWIYINGVLSATDTSVTTFTVPSPTTWYIGTWPTGVDALDGCIAEVASWDRALTNAEISSLARATNILELEDWTENVNSGASGSFDPAPHANPSVGWTVSSVVDEGLVNLTAAGTTVTYAIGSTTADVVDTPQVTISKGGLSKTATISVWITGAGAPPPGGFQCVTTGSGTLVNLGSATNKESTTNLSTGGNARYDASGIIARTLWSGVSTCVEPTSGRKRSGTTNQFLFRCTANHSGGCVSGGAIYSNLTPHEDRDNNPANNDDTQLYPCSHGGQVLMRDFNISNFTIEGFRFHGCWDAVRCGLNSTEVIQNISVKGCWFTCTRDEPVENDSYSDGQVFEDNLVGNVIGSNPNNSGCFRFYSMYGGDTDRTSRRIVISNNLIWSSQFKATASDNLINGYCVGNPFKLKTPVCPRVHLTGNTFLIDAQTESTSGGGDPFGDLNKNGGAVLASSSGNRILWRDLGGLGSYTARWPLPPGFQLVEGSAALTEWNNKVNTWKTNHPHVRRFNISGIARPYGGSFDLVD